MAKLLERVQFHKSGEVDREAGVVPGVKLLGLVSQNGRRYTENALRNAASLYEDANVYLNHVKPGQSRDVRDLGGAIRNVSFREGQGLFGDLHYLKGDPAGEKIATLAGGNLKKVGMSHDADGRLERRNGESVVEEINEVNSVDVVDRPATTKGFREQTMKTTLRKLIEATGYKHTAKLLEMLPEMPADEEVAVVEPEEGESAPDPIDAVADALAAKVADAIKDPNVTDAEAGQMAKNASKTVASVRSDMEPKAEEPAPEEGDGETEEEENTTEAAVAKAIGKLTERFEASEKRNAELAKQLDARAVLESKGAQPTAQLIEELVACDDRKAMETLVEGWTPAKLGKPRPSLGSLRESASVPDTSDTYLASLKARGLRS